MTIARTLTVVRFVAPPSMVTYFPDSVVTDMARPLRLNDHDFQDVNPFHDSRWKQQFRRNLKRWFTGNARDFPWRKTRDPYCIWVSEIMLQQTQAATVVGYYQRFIQRFPTCAALAAAEENDVLRQWEGLGYYRRARQLHRAAQIIVKDRGGQFPEKLDEMISLPGVGRYTAGAVLSIAYDQRQPILEANTIRLFSRLISFAENPATANGQKTLWRFAERILPRKHCGDFNQALMELGAEVCRPQTPRCEDCPVRSLCTAHRDNVVDSTPLKRKPPRVEDIHEAAVIVVNRKRVLLRRRGNEERWAGMWDFPRFVIEDDASFSLTDQLASLVKAQTGCRVQIGERFATIKHSVTRFRITLDCYFASCTAGPPKRMSANLKWASIQQLDRYALSVTGRKIGRMMGDAP